MAKVALNSETEAAAPGGLYTLVWRWHFYAGLLVAPFVLMLAITGAIYLFDSDLDAIVHRDVTAVSTSGTPLPVSAQEAAVLASYPGSQLTQYQAPIAVDRAAAWKLVAADGKALTAYVDPYTARVIGDVPEGQRLGEVVMKLHGELLAGPAGDYVVEFAACWAFILLATGVFLWWPRSGRPAGVLAPNLKARGRGFWRDLHAIPAAWNAPIVAFLILTGLPWTGFWGGMLASLGTTSALTEIMAPTPNFHAAPAAGDPHAMHRSPDKREVSDDLPWSIRNAAYPSVPVSTGRISIEQAIAEAASRNMMGPNFRVFYPAGPGEVFTLSHVPDRAESQRTVYLDPADGRVVDDIPWERYSPVGKAVEFGVQTHMGRQFGLANKLLMAASCVVLVLTIAFGLVMWWKRRPGARLKPPPVTPGYRIPSMVIALAVGLGILFPLVGASMLLILLWELMRRGLRPA
jgi:uncharacterized iron-regulated membrane protein